MEKIFDYLETKKEKEHDESLLNISAIGGCFMKIFLEKKGVFKEDYDPSLKRIFRAGDAYHSLIYNEIIERAYESGVHVIANELDLKDVGNHLKGRCDCIISDGKENIVLDIKSCSDWAFKKYVDESSVPPQYIVQLQLYMYILKLKKGILLFVNKNNQKTGEVGIEYDEGLVKELLIKINQFYDNMQNNIPPEPCDGGDFGCKACAYYREHEQEILEKLKEKENV